MCYRSTVILIRIETRFPGAGITLLSVMWKFLLDGKYYITMLRKSYWSESQCLLVILSTWILVITLKGPKSLIGHQPDSVTSGSLLEWLVLFEEWKHCIIYFKSFCVLCLLPIYCSFTVLLLWKSSKVELIKEKEHCTDFSYLEQEQNWFTASSSCYVRLSYVWAWGMYLHWRTMNFELCGEPAMQHLSSLFHLVIVQ